MKGSDLYDNHSHKVTSVKGNDIYNEHSHKIVTMNDVRRDVKGGLGGATLTALWLCFIR